MMVNRMLTIGDCKDSLVRIAFFQPTDIESSVGTKSCPQPAGTTMTKALRYLYDFFLQFWTTMTKAYRQFYNILMIFWTAATKGLQYFF